MSDLQLPIGATAVVRGVINGRVWYEQAVRVLDVGTNHAVTARWPGTSMRRMTLFIESLRTGSRELRAQAVQALARGDWEMADSAWQGTGVVEQVASGRWFSVSRVFGADGAPLGWYVNFERPPAWRPDGWETSDLALDIVVKPDGEWQWKDEDEYEQERRLGLITDAEHAAVQAAREEAIALIESRHGLFAASPEQRWLPDPEWRTPSLA